MNHSRNASGVPRSVLPTRVRAGLQWIGLALLVLGLASARTTSAGEVTVSEAPLVVPTYSLGPEDQNPAFRNASALGARKSDAPVYNQNVYPYAMQTGITNTKADKTYDAVVLENDFIRVIILPELGGRIYAAHDKTNHDFDFIYHNHVIKPSLVALRGAWISGGIEWNFPTRGHTTNTFSPVAHRIVPGEDGSVTCIVGTTEWVRRMKWAVGITLYPDRSCFRTRIMLRNPTLSHNRAYFWANAATHAWPDTRVTFPPSDHTFAGMRRHPEPWPINHGRDVSWYKNTPFAHDYFCGVAGDYHGAYNVDRDCGTVHTASRYESPGQKFWTWGTAPSGTIWEDLLTDEDGQYIEVQAGRLPTQGDTWIFEPHMQEQWDEYWYPVKDMKGFVKASREAAVNLVAGDDAVLAAVNATRVYEDAEVRLSADGKQVFTRKLTIGPRTPWEDEIPIGEKAKSWQLELRDKSGQPIITYSTEPEPLPEPDLEPEFPPEEDATADQAYLAGYYALKHWRADQAEALFEAALQKDPGFTPALRSLAILRYQAGSYQQAYELSKAVLGRNEDDDTASYYYALARIKLGVNERTEQDLHRIGRRAAYRHVAPYVLASLAVKRGDLAQAEILLRRAVSNNSRDLRARTLLAAVMRHIRDSDEATAIVEQVLEEDPLDELALQERLVLTGKENDVKLLVRDPQYYLEAACAYLEMNLLDDAVAVLERCRETSGVLPHPFVDLYLGYLADRQGRQEHARECYQRGLALSPKAVFPFRIESFEVLRTGLRYEPESWKLHYYLGTLLTAKRRWKEGLEEFLAAEKASPECPMLYANLGMIYCEKLGDLERATAAYEKAKACDPGDYHYYVALDQLYAEAKDEAKRERLFSEAPREVESDFRVRFSEAESFYDQGRNDEALRVLAETTFTPWEGATAVHQLYQRVLNARAERRMQQGDYEHAIEDLQLAMEYPRNLGVGRPYNPDFGEEYYQLGLCYRAIGRNDRARDCLTKAARSSDWNEKAREVLKSLGK